VRYAISTIDPILVNELTCGVNRRNARESSIFQFHHPLQQHDSRNEDCHRFEMRRSDKQSLTESRRPGSRLHGGTEMMPCFIAREWIVRGLMVRRGSRGQLAVCRQRLGTPADGQ
jgi:hypothetical protein